MNRITFIFAGSIVLFLALTIMLFQNDRANSPASGQPLILYCAASNQAVINTICADYEAEFGRSVQVTYGPSQMLLASVEVTKDGDLFLPADDSYLDLAAEKNLIDEIIPIARMQAVIAVPKGNPRNIQTLADVMADGVTFVQANPETAAVGRLTRNKLRFAGSWDTLDQATDVYHTTVTDVARDIEASVVDAGIVFDAVLHTYDNVDSVEAPELEDVFAQTSVAVLSSTKHSAAALHFARYLSAKDRGLKRYAQFGFQVARGDQWSEVPELNIFAGSMLRPVIEETIAAFEQREGVRVNPLYNGCGILVGKIKAGVHPDAYFACDSEFMDQVADLFPEPVPVSENELVILVQKGNPFNIASLRDLSKAGLRVGIGHEKQCAMGWITQNTFRESGVESEVMANVTTQLPTGDMLVNQLQAKSLDAAVAYLSNAAGAGDSVDAIQIQGIDCSTATQPWAVATDSKYPETASRLFKQICSAESQEIFAAEGFRWTK